MRFMSFMILTMMVLATSVSGVRKPAVKSLPVVDPAYSGVRIVKFPWAVQAWTFRKFSLFDTLKKMKELGVQNLEAYPGQEIGGDLKGVKFDHTLTDPQIEQVKTALTAGGITVVAYGVVKFANDEPSMRQVFDFARKIGIRTIVTEPEYDDYSLLERMVKEYDIQVAIHNHPLPSKYALPQTVLDHIRNLDARIGACADTGHWMRCGVQPLAALKLLSGRILDVHLKDLNKFDYKKAYDVPFGTGKAGIRDILAELTLQGYKGFLAVEHENEKEVNNPSPSILKGMEVVKGMTYYQDYEEILATSAGRYGKRGWNHYGPGYFTLDERTGVLQSQGGMGLFWYSVRKYKDFILELDYRCSRMDTNSGVFLRVPDLPASDDYIYHSFEIQICDAEEGIHKTGAAYDAEPPMADAAHPTGEWNHYKITFRDSRIQVELNGKAVLDWQAQPRGKVKDFAAEGYVGLQNHDSISPVCFKNIYIKELK